MIKKSLLIKAKDIRGGHGLGQHAARPVVHYVGRGPVTVKKFYFRTALAWARLDGLWAGPRAKRSFPLFFSLKLSKIQKKQHKTQVRPAWGTSAARGQNLEISSLTWHSQPWDYHFPNLAGGARKQARPMPKSSKSVCSFSQISRSIRPFKKVYVYGLLRPIAIPWPNMVSIYILQPKQSTSYFLLNLQVSILLM